MRWCSQGRDMPMTVTASMTAKRPVDLGPQHGLKLRRVLWTHERVVLTRYIDVPIRHTREVIPALELVSQPSMLRAPQRMSIEHSRGLHRTCRCIGFAGP